MRKLLLLNGKLKGTSEYIQAAHEMGAHVIVSDEFTVEESLGKSLADEVWDIPCFDADALEKRCKEENINGILCGIDEDLMEVVIELCDRLNLPCYTSASQWKYSSDKSAFKELCQKNGVRVPKDYACKGETLDEIVAKDIRYPVVVKPIDLDSNRGVFYCQNQEELEKAYKEVEKLTEGDHILVEQCIRGNEWVATYAMADGEISFLGLGEMIADSSAPKNCYTIITTATNHIDDYINGINKDVERMFKNAGFNEGIAWVQVMRDEGDDSNEDGQFYLIEMGYRLGGDMLWIPFKEMDNFDCVWWLVHYALYGSNDPKELPPTQIHPYTQCACVYTFFTKHKGSVKQVEGLDTYKENPNFHVYLQPRIDIEMPAFWHFGLIIFVAPNCDAMCQVIEDINKNVRFLEANGEDLKLSFHDGELIKQRYIKGLEGK